MTKLIYIIEDDDNIRELIKLSLLSYNYEVKDFVCAEEALNNIEMDQPSLACFDIMLPGINGFEAIRRIRNTESVKNIPVLVLTARDNEMDKIKGFEAGADDYITKPFSVLEFCARIKALIRRSYYAGKNNKFIQQGTIEINLETRTVYNCGELIDLTYKEYDLLLLLITRKNQILDRETLLSTIWGYGVNNDTRTLDVHIRHLREKLKSAGDCIKTIRGVGYRFVFTESI